jgi:hypothetical protein
VKQTGAVTLSSSLKSGTSAVLSATGGGLANTYTTSEVHGTTSTFTVATVSGAISTLSFKNCKEEAVVDAPGNHSVENISGTTNKRHSSLEQR